VKVKKAGGESSHESDTKTTFRTWPYAMMQTLNPSVTLSTGINSVNSRAGKFHVQNVELSVARYVTCSPCFIIAFRLRTILLQHGREVEDFVKCFVRAVW
jgi:hypothetical protein